MNKRNNKGFSLIELIVVVAIMAVLVGVLAPTYLKYVEKTRVQKDVSAVGEFVQAIKVASADELVNKELTGKAVTFDITKDGNIYNGKSGNLITELQGVIEDVKLGSSATTKVTVNAQVVDGIVKVEVKAVDAAGKDIAAFKDLSTGTVCTCAAGATEHTGTCPLAPKSE